MSGSALTDPINDAPAESNAELKPEQSKWASQFGTEPDKAWVDRPVKRVASYTVGAVKTAPCSCACGGDTAFVLDIGGWAVMLGCACHTWFDAGSGRFVKRLDQPAAPKDKLKLRVYYSEVGDE